MLYSKHLIMDNDTILRDATEGEYKYGFTSDIDTEIVPAGLNEDVIRLISRKKGEPDWLLDFRLKAYRHWLTLPVPDWGHLSIPEIDFQAISYYAAPKPAEKKKSMDEVDPELVKTFNKLGISLEEQKHLSGVAVDAVMDSVGVKTTHQFGGLLRRFLCLYTQGSTLPYGTEYLFPNQRCWHRSV